MAQVLAFIKKNVLIIICAVVAICAIVAIFWPINGYYSSLQTDVDARKAAFSSAKTLLTKPRTLPVLDPLSTDPQTLDVFPTEAVIARGKTATAAIGDESKAMLDTAKNLVKHNPLVANALPDGGTMDATFFLRQYQQIMTFPSTDPDQMASSLPVTILHAGMPPTQPEITARQQEVQTEITNQQTEKDNQGNPINADEVAAKVASAVDVVPVQMRTDAATKNQMYIAPDAFHINPALTGVNPPGTVAMFNGQVGLWLLQDVFSALASANADEPYGKPDPAAPDAPLGVPASRVKHLLKIDFADAPFSPLQNADPNAPAPAAPDPLHPDIKLNVSPTGHVSNALYDVVPFTLRIVVDAQQVPMVLQALSKDRFITVLRLDMLRVDSGAAVLAGYLYGDKPVVQLNLSCEELFFRDDTLPYMPDSIKKALGIAPPPAPAAQ